MLELCRQSDVLLFVYDTCAPIDLNSISPMLEFREKLIFVGNKVDELEEFGNYNTIADVTEFCAKNNLEHYFVSAKKGTLVHDFLRLRILDSCQMLKDFDVASIYKE